MIQEIITQWEQNKDKLREWFETTPQNKYDRYIDIVDALFTYVIEDYQKDEIKVLDHGSYQGTQIFIIPKDRYQPDVDDYLYTHTYYGSCSGCDTLLGISGYGDELPSKEQVDQYMLLALHLVQRMKFLKD